MAGKHNLPEGLRVCINYEFNLLNHVRTVAKIGGVRRRRTKVNTYTPLGPTGRGTKSTLVVLSAG